jgi:hypothetical protein
VERELWKVVYHHLKWAARYFDQKYAHLHPWRIAAVLLWAALHDRPVSWACDKRNWSATRLRPGRLPSPSTVSRRAGRTAFHLFLNRLAERLLTRVRGRGVLLGDGNYEASRIYDAAAGSGYLLLAPPDPQDTGRGHTYQSPVRALALRWFADGLGWSLLRGRSSIERAFGNAGSFGGGLGPLPRWVRRLGRVTRWVWCKLAINAARILRNRQRMEGLK